MNKQLPERLKPEVFESKWQKTWEENGVYSPDVKNPNKPYFNLMMFPYPSAEGLHVGNMYAFTGVDVHGRFMRMQGYDVFEPIGLDGFGIHSENYALKVNRHPKEQAKISEKNFYRQMRAIGNGFDWTRSVETYDPNYYKWTQWLFVQMFKHGLAYRDSAEVNWCPSCKTVLADEQVIKSVKRQASSVKQEEKELELEVCERCGTGVERKKLEQWFFKITEYAEKLLENTYLPSFNWSEKVKIGQQNWIGKKAGIDITYSIKDSSHTVVCWTSRPDTNFGATFIVIAPEHPLALEITTKEHIQNVKKYIETSKNKSKEDRIGEGNKKTGAFTGAYAINNLNQELMPIWVSDFVIWGVGTGAVVGVPGHDKRDFEFAQAMDISIKRVVVGQDGDTSEITKLEQVQEESGTMINSGFLDGLDIHTATEKIMVYLEEKGFGKRKNNYHLRDWLISRQRYWGAPIPMIYCQSCAKNHKSWFDTKESHSLHIDADKKHSMHGWYPVPEVSLPVILPDVEDWRPTGSGRGPLAAIPEFYEVCCPECGEKAVRETDVCDTFLDSSWYFLRYPSVKDQGSKAKGQDNLELPWNLEINKNWLPVDSYIGGAEHTVLHLLYARFVWMALKDWNYLPLKNETVTDDYNPHEPFKRFFAHGLIIKDGTKMSKSKGNVVVPDEYIKLYGADTLRTYLMFLGSFESGGDFRDTGIQGMYRWLSRVWRLTQEAAKNLGQETNLDRQDGLKHLHKTIKGVTEDLNQLGYNTAIAKMMEFTNWWMDHPGIVDTTMAISFLKILAPFAPHMTEELFQSLKLQTESAKNNGFESIHIQSWPTFDENLIHEGEVVFVVQVNGKLRQSFRIDAEQAKSQDKVEQLVRASAKVNKWLENKEIKKVIFVSQKLINFVI